MLVRGELWMDLEEPDDLNFADVGGWLLVGTGYGDGERHHVSIGFLIVSGNLKFGG